MLVFVIKQLRVNRNITLYELSKKSSISRSYLIELENNKKTNPSISILQKIADVLNVNIKELFYSEIEIEHLKQEMYKRIDEHGINSSKVIEISQIIDLLVNIEMQSKKD